MVLLAKSKTRHSSTTTFFLNSGHWLDHGSFDSHPSDLLARSRILSYLSLLLWLSRKFYLCRQAYIIHLCWKRNSGLINRHQSFSLRIYWSLKCWRLSWLHQFSQVSSRSSRRPVISSFTTSGCLELVCRFSWSQSTQLQYCHCLTSFLLSSLASWRRVLRILLRDWSFLFLSSTSLMAANEVLTAMPISLACRGRNTLLSTIPWLRRVRLRKL